MRSGYPSRSAHNDASHAGNRHDSIDRALHAAARRFANPHPFKSGNSAVEQKFKATIIYGEQLPIPPYDSNDCPNVLVNDPGATTTGTVYLFHIEYDSDDFEPPCSSRTSGETDTKVIQSAMLLYNFAVAHLLRSSCVDRGAQWQHRWRGSARRLFDLSYAIMKTRLASVDSFQLLDDNSDTNWYRLVAITHWIAKSILELSCLIRLPIHQYNVYQVDARRMEKFANLWRHEIPSNGSAAGAA